TILVCFVRTRSAPPVEASNRRVRPVLYRDAVADRESPAASRLRRTFRPRPLRGRLMLGPMQRPAYSSRSTIIDLPVKEGLMTPNIADIIRHHVSLEVRCIDRLFLHAYMPKLQTSGGLCYFLRDYLGHPIPSPALFKPMHDRFVTAVEQFVTRHAVPVVHFEAGQDK